MTKKNLTIAAIVLLVIGLGLIYYYFFFAKTPGTQVAGNTPTGTNFFPFGQGGTTPQDQGTSTASNNDQPYHATNYLDKLRLISNEPVAGATFMESPSGVYIRYIEKATGHIFDVATFSADTHEVSNTTIPKIHNASFTEKGNSVITQSVADDGETVSTLYAKIASTTTGIALPANIDSVSVAPSTNSIFYIQKSSAASIGIASLPNGGGKKQIWNSKIKSVLPQFAGENQIIITTKPNAQILGYAYLVNIKTGGIQTVVQNIPDLSTFANPSGTLLLYTGSANRELSVYSLSANTTTTMTPKALPEKCVFDPNNKNIFYCAVSSGAISGSILDDWYLGLVSFSDDIWRYDLSTGTSAMIESLSGNAGRDIDAINLQFNSAGSLLIFTSKSDGSLWSLNVGQ